MGLIEMKAVILAAGEGKRMWPLTATRPKGMLPVANKPILEHILTEMSKAGVKEFIFVVGYKWQMVRDYFGDGSKWGLRVDYVIQEGRQGTASAVAMVEWMVGDKFIVSNGDILIKAEDITKLVSTGIMNMAVVDVKDTTGLGVVTLQGETISIIHEKTGVEGLANAGLYLLTRQIFHAIEGINPSPRGENELIDAFQSMIDTGYLLTFTIIDSWLNISYPWDLLTANEVLVKGTILSGTVLRDNCYLDGPVQIGHNCTLGPNCYIRGATSIGDNCHIGAGVEVKNSIIMSGTKIPHLSYVGDSVIGENCNLGAGTIIANQRLDKKTVIVNGVDTKRVKFGTIIGDNVQTGINTSIMPGTVIEANEKVM